MAYPGGSTIIIVVLIRGMQDKSEPEEKVICFEDGERGHESSNVGGHKKLEKARKETDVSFRASRRDQSPQHLDFGIVK